MKKTLIVLALAFALIAMSTCVAFAANPTAPNSALHGGYALTTNACVQCHDVHGAETYVDAPLWRWADAAEGCEYCHGDGTGAGGATNTDVYVVAPGATAEHAIGAIDIPDATDNTQITDGAPAVVALDCFDCHDGGVHGAAPSGFYPVTSEATSNAFCGRCHDENLTGGAAPLGTSHVLAAADNTHAWEGSEDCVSCHDDGSAADFPHTSGNYVFAGADSNVAQLDAVCLDCHWDDTDLGTLPNLGVGYTY